MGDFDKQQTTSPVNAAANEKRKLMLVGILGAALLGLVWFHFMKAGPQSASAAGVEGGSGEGPAAVSQTPAQALAALDAARDPTAKLLLGTSILPAEFMEVPRDPFKISQAWKTQLVKVGEVVKAPVAARVETAAAAATPSAPKVSAEGLKLTGIFRRDQKLYASINGNLLTVGMTMGSARVVEIGEDRVMLRHVDWPGGPVTTVMIQGGK